MKNNDNIGKQLKEHIGEAFVKDNPYVSSPQFIHMVHLASLLPRTALGETTNSGEGVNAVLSLVVSMLKNIPDGMWEIMQTTVSEQDDDNPTHAMFRHLDALRSYKGSNYMKVEFEERDMPAFTTKPPTTHC